MFVKANERQCVNQLFNFLSRSIASTRSFRFFFREVQAHSIDKRKRRHIKSDN